ncbi:hypothetical protein [Mycolicibacterium neworleansense]|uniref:Uncharacterized protein n=1 Tax=Mycolicibacterium neworleansense TaxID=146018 RepID=A0A0H5S1D6_9MYCO|nr:hypothetical protein [Mycolicibacterium neworleansense]MCV7363839.1 hypothetical protein [Mycolicibacterium neworleansense]CRZ14819.1 hypothetical protein BN2156_01675 [Mycolicibacterium neworleansense]
MTEGDPADKLSATRQFVVVVRVAIEGNGEVTGELVDPISEQRRRFTELSALADEVRNWIEDVVGKAIDDQHRTE